MHNYKFLNRKKMLFQEIMSAVAALFFGMAFFIMLVLFAAAATA